MWKSVAKEVAVYGTIYCVFGVLGVGFVMAKWLGPSLWRRKDRAGPDAAAPPESPTADPSPEPTA